MIKVGSRARSNNTCFNFPCRLAFCRKNICRNFNKLRLLAVLGELIAGIIVGPFALGSIPIFDGKPLVILNETVLQIGQIAGIVILLLRGLPSLRKNS